MQNKSVQAVLFDLDGTLVDTIEDIQDALNRALFLEDLPPLDIEMTKKVVGRGLRNALIGAVQLWGKEFPPEHIDRMYATMMEYYRKNHCVKSKPYEGILSLLEDLDRQDVLLAVFSNKEDGLTGEVVRTLFPHIRFSWVRGMRSDFPRKPDRAGLAYFAKKYGLTVENLLYVGDSEVDYQTAVNAGCKHILVSWGFRGREDLARLNPSTLVDSVEELQEAINDLQ
ncbi:MAG TPA: HAD family hydrolase [Sphaerochaeta sp.]|nr:HAD family hydrolase [Sphaerochaeta sp.]